MITQKELIQRGWIYNAFSYRDNGEAELITKEANVLVDTKDVDTGAVEQDGTAIYQRTNVYETITIVTGQNIIKHQDKVEEYVKQFFKVQYWRTVISRVANPLFDVEAEIQDQPEFLEESKLEIATTNVSDLALVSKLDVIRSVKTFFAFIIDTKDGFKVQLKTDLNLIVPTVFSTEELGEEKFNFSYADLAVKFEELIGLKLEDH